MKLIGKKKFLIVNGERMAVLRPNNPLKVLRNNEAGDYDNCTKNTTSFQFLGFMCKTRKIIIDQ